jgi:hypothetical protein
MNNGALYRAAIEAEGRIMASMTRRQYAENDVRRRGLAYDSAAADARGVYVSAMQQMGIPESDLRGLTSYDLERMLRAMPRGGARGRRPAAMAADSNRTPDALDEILDGSPRPTDLTER